MVELRHTGTHPHDDNENLRRNHHVNPGREERKRQHGWYILLGA